MELTKDLTNFNNLNTPTGIEFFDSTRIRDNNINGVPYLVIGTNGSSNICFNKIDGSICLADEIIDFFVNSSLNQFTECLIEHNKLFHGKKMTDEENYQSSLRLREVVQSIDPKAVAKDTFWYWITEEQIEIYEAWNDN